MTNTSREEKPVLSIIQEVKAGSLNPKTLFREERQRCVEVLTAEGLTESAIAQVFELSDRTIRRDLADIRQKNSLSPNIDFAKQFVGDLFTKAKNHHGYLMRLARSATATVGEKVGAELAAWKVLKEVIEKLQTLGYLPSVPQKMQSEIFFHQENNEEEESLDTMRKTLSEIESIAKESGSLTPDVLEELEDLRNQIKKAELAEKVAKTKNQIKNMEENKNE